MAGESRNKLAFVGCLGAAIGAGLLATVATIALVVFGLSIVEEEVHAHLSQNEVVRDKLGAVRGVSILWAASAAIDDEDTFVYLVNGAKADARVHVRSTTDDDGNEQFNKIILYWNGEQIVLADDGQ
jgi:hypothetical protein